jgi:hypothetical protein
MRCALEVRAIAPIPKGTEVFISYVAKLQIRADRRRVLSKRGFLCKCDLCSLSDIDSNTLDHKILAAMEEEQYVDQMIVGKHNDYVGAARCIENIMTTVAEERMFTPNVLMMPIRFLAFFKKLRLWTEVGRVLMPILVRYWGTEGGTAAELPADILSGYLKNPSALQNWKSTKLPNLGEEFYARLEEVASNIITILKRLP